MAIFEVKNHEHSILPEGNWKLTWADEFDGTELDRSKWDFRMSMMGQRWPAWTDKGVALDGKGNLVFTMLEEDGRIVSSQLQTGYNFMDEPVVRTKFGVSDLQWPIGKLKKSMFTHSYGYFECRAILPASSGMWSAFWMMNTHVEDVDGSGQDGTEVDIYESMYYKDNWWGAGGAVISGIHYDGYGEGQQSASIGKWWVNNPYEEYNTYGLEWNEKEYIFYINGIETGRLSKGGVSQNPEYLILSCEVAGENGVAWADRHGVGKMSMDTDETAEFIVDYVRVYQYK